MTTTSTPKTFPIVADYRALDEKRKAALRAGKCERASVLRSRMEAIYSAMTAAAQRQLGGVK